MKRNLNGFRNGLVFVSLLIAVMFFLTLSSTAMATNYTLTLVQKSGCALHTTGKSYGFDVTVTSSAGSSSGHYIASTLPKSYSVPGGYSVQIGNSVQSGYSNYSYTFSPTVTLSSNTGNWITFTMPDRKSVV